MTNAVKKILVADDDKNICELIRLYLQKEGFETVLAYDGEEALAQFRSTAPDLVLLDMMMPRLDGSQVCREIRRVSQIPIIVVTAKGETFDKVLMLELGADDYLVKPIDTKELVARIKAVLRRSDPNQGTCDKEVIFPHMSINLTNFELKLDGKAIDIPPKELELLFFLASHPNRVFTRDQLLQQVWDFDYFGDSRTVDVHVKRLREKLAGYEAHWQIKTVCRVGYKFEVKA